ncbi:MAG: acyltransferase [Bdellovibrionales bacterium]
MQFVKHETAIVDEGALIGKGTKIWHWVHICSGAKIGESCSLGQNVFVGNKVSIGSGTKIQNNVSVYDDVSIGKNVFCGPSMVFTNVYNPRASVVRKDEYRTTNVEDNVTIGANATIVCGVNLGFASFIAAGSVVNKDVKAFSLVAGVPAKQIGWMSLHGERVELPLSGEGTWTCEHTGQVYTLKGETLSLKEI